MTLSMTEGETHDGARLDLHKKFFFWFYSQCLLALPTFINVHEKTLFAPKHVDSLFLKDGEDKSSFSISIKQFKKFLPPSLFFEGTSASVGEATQTRRSIRSFGRP